MKKILLGSVATGALIAAGSANAADLGRPVYKAAPVVAPPVPIFSWTGCYVGAHVGWGWGKTDTTVTRVCASAGAQTVGGTRAFKAATGGIDTSGAIFGGQVGCDYQFAGNFVIGIQGSLAGTAIDGVGPDPFDPTDPSEFIHVKTDWIGDVTGRLGFTGWFPQAMIYIKGGGAWKQDRIHWASDVCDEAACGGFFKHTFSGWTVGGGIEWAFAPNWSAFVEFDHYDFGNKRVNIGFSTDGFQSLALDVKERIETVKVGINYRFNLFGKGKAPVTARY